MPRTAFLFLMLASGAAVAQQPAPEQTLPQNPPAQPSATPAVPTPTEEQLAAQRKVEWFIKFPTELGLASSLDGSGNVTVSRVGADFEVDIPIATRGELDLGFSYDYTRYDFNDATGFVAGSTSPFQDIHREAFRVYYGQQQTLQLGWSVGGSIGLSGEEGADTADSVVGSVFAGVGYYLSRDLRVGVAVGIFSQLEQSPLILPIPTFKWDISPEWRLATAGKPGLTLFYSPNELWTFSAGAWYDLKNFRLSESGPIPGGVGRDEGVPVQLGVSYKPTANVSMDLTGGVRLMSNYEVLNSSGNKIADVESDPMPYLGITIGLKF